jgi:hypothetical protein
VSDREINFFFSGPVKVVSLNFDTGADVESIEEGEKVTVYFSESLREGEKITADMLVEDERRNSLNVLVPFRTRNNRLPDMIINELRTENSKPKVEFVEFRTLSPGNLGALRLFIAGHSLEKPVYEFPPTEVKAGEYIVLHLRATETGWADETGDDLALSGGTDASKSARDFWINGNEKLLHKNDAVYLLDQDDVIIDAVLLSEIADPWWNKQDLATAAELLGGQGAWLPSGDAGENYIPGPADAVISTGTTATRTISRDESIGNNRRAGDWYIVATSSATPGTTNSTKRWQ